MARFRGHRAGLPLSWLTRAIFSGGQAQSVGLQHIWSALLIVDLELVLLAVVCGALDALTAVVLSRVRATRQELTSWRERGGAANTIRKYLVASFVLLAGIVVAYNGWLVAQGVDVVAHTRALVRSVDSEMRAALARSLGTLVLAMAGVVIASRLIRRLLRSAERALKRWDRISKNNRSLEKFFRGRSAPRFFSSSASISSSRSES